MLLPYPKIYQLGHRSIKDIFDSDVIIEEKVDGSQISFGVYEGELKIRSKGKELILDAPEKMFATAVEQIKERRHLIKEGYTYRGEYLQRPKHNALAYDRVPLGNIMIFDIKNSADGYLPYLVKQEEAERLGFECVPLVFAGIITPDQIPSLLDRVSILGGPKVEGVVVKNHDRFTFEGHPMIGKFVSEAFKETHRKEWKASNPNKKDIIERLINTYRHEGRWAKAVQHLREAGTLLGEPKDIAALIKEVQSDITAECTEEIKEQLFRWAMPQVLRGSINGLPEWYKSLLLGEVEQEQGKE